MNIAVGNWFAIYKRELQSYFKSPLAYIIAGVFWLMAGIFFLVSMGSILDQVAALDFQQQQFGGPAQPIDVPYLLLQGFLGVLASLMLVIMPMLSMGLYAEERKRGTLELLATSPITNWAVALGKLLAAVTFFLGMLLPIMVYEAVIFASASPAMPISVFLISHLGLILLAAAVLSLGMFISSLTNSTILAAILTFGLALMLWVIEAATANASGPIGQALGHLSLLRHFNTLTQGIVDSGSLAMLATYIFLGIFLTAQAVETFRFQRS